VSSINPLDALLLVVLALSVLLGLLRGFMREVISVAGWVLGVLLAYRHADEIGDLMLRSIEPDALRTAAAAVAIVVICVFAAALLGWIVRKLLVAARLSAADRTLGALFGLARALAIVALVALLGRDTSLRRESWWRESIVMSQIESALRWQLDLTLHPAATQTGA
jgi:membrane protein required for colicin V production